MKEKYFLDYNRDNIFISLIQAEVHLRNISEGSSFSRGHGNCVVKHLAEIEGEAGEAISHALVVEGKEASRKFAELRDKARNVRYKIQNGQVDSSGGIKAVREVKVYFESFNPSYDLSKCTACGGEPVGDARTRLEALANKLKETDPDLRSMEDDYSQRVISTLSSKYKLKPPKLEVDETCDAPDKALYDDGKIKTCRSGANAHVLIHEFGHYYQHQQGKSLNEAEAERFVKENLEQGLYSHRAKYHSNNGGSKTMFKITKSAAKETLMYAGSAVLGYGIGRLGPYVDSKYPTTFLGEPVSTYMGIGSTAVGVYAGLKSKSKYRDAIMITGLVGGLNLLIPVIERKIGFGAVGLGAGQGFQNFQSMPSSSYSAVRSVPSGVNITKQSGSGGKYVVG